VRRSLSVVLVLALCGTARADLVVNWAVDGTITGAGALIYVLSDTALKATLGPSECRWCDVNLNRLDREAREAFRWTRELDADYVSNVTGFMLAPGIALGLIGVVAERDGKLANWPADALVVLESAVLAANLNQLAKMTVGRQRPFVRYRIPDPRLVAVEDNMSFYSGHASLSFSLAVASGTVASMRGYRYAPIIWASGLTAATLTGYLRIAADRHYLTDVLTGAAIGSAFGFAVPYLFHRGDTRLVVTPSEIAVVGRW
jgi:membrane-associated phospholipid phosphatase